jgi:trehalose 6-phosphate phosphatase
MTSPTNEPAAASTLAELLHRLGPIALFLDFDGVLAEIAPTPEAVEVPATVIARLQSLNSALDGALAVVTGRGMADIDGFLAPLILPVAAEHGNVRRSRDGSIAYLDSAAAEVIPALADELRNAFAEDRRILVEQKASAVAVHYRLAPELGEICKEVVAAAASTRPGLSVIPGKMVIECRAAGADKGSAVTAYMQDAPFSGRSPVFIGDDLTDEDGFAAAQGLGGVGIKVGPGDTAASHRIPATAHVPAVLDAIIRSQETLP